jgi:hypothetical protein
MAAKKRTNKKESSVGVSYTTKKTKLTPTEKAMITALYSKIEGAKLPKVEKGLAKAKKKGDVRLSTQPYAFGWGESKGSKALEKEVIRPALKKSKYTTTTQQKEERRRSAARYLRRK